MGGFYRARYFKLSARFRPFYVLIILFLSQVVWASVLFLLYKESNYIARVLNSTIGIVAYNAIGAVIAMAVTVYFSGVRSWSDFDNAFAIGFPRIKVLNFSICLGILWSIVAIYLLRSTGTQVESQLTRDFSSSDGGAKHVLFGVMGIGAAWFEEMILRGYIYSEMRKYYSSIISTCVFCLVALALHRTAIQSATIVGLILIGFTIILCAIREYTNNTWNCVACHLAYNVIVVFY